MILCICWTQLQGKIEFISKCKFRILFYSYINAWYIGMVYSMYSGLCWIRGVTDD